MKCRGKKCPRYYEGDYNWCYELNVYMYTDAECDLLGDIAKVRDELVRKCRLFEEVFEIDCGSSLDDELEKIEF